MRSDAALLADILDAADHVANFIAGLSPEQFRESELVRSAVVEKFAVIGEAARHLSKDFRDRHAEIPWPQVIAFRNLLIHAYFSVDWDIVWRTAVVRRPQLRDQIVAIAGSENDTAG